MGRPMVARLLAAGHIVRALGRNPAKRRDLEQLGAIAVRDIPEAGAQADVVVVEVCGTCTTIVGRWQTPRSTCGHSLLARSPTTTTTSSGGSPRQTVRTAPTSPDSVR